MSITKTLGGDRLGSGNKQKVEMHGYERSSFNVSKIWRSTMSAGTLVPCLNQIGTPGTTFDIEFDAEINTHPSIGPLFGSYKFQIDAFRIPLRIFNSITHNDTVNIGRDMSQVKFPLIELLTPPKIDYSTIKHTIDTSQINPSCLLAYLGIRGIGLIETGSMGAQATRKFNAVGILSYWEAVKYYYSAKFEEIAAVIHNDNQVVDIAKITSITHTTALGGSTVLNKVPPGALQSLQTNPGAWLLIQAASAGEPDWKTIGILTPAPGGWKTTPILDVITVIVPTTTANEYIGYFKPENLPMFIGGWNYIIPSVQSIRPRVETFPLSNIDLMKKEVLALWDEANALLINDADLIPYKYLYQHTNGIANSLASQEGLAVKTYQSDLFNNWLKTENIDQVATATAINTSGGSFTIDTFIFNKKMYDLLMRINVAGGSTDDWLEAVYAHEQHSQPEKPVYMGGLIKELVFQEVVSNAQTSDQPLGTLAGKGVLAQKHKGGQVIIRCDEPSYILVIASLTPRIDYSQGNKWFTHLLTWDDLHKPQMDQIGFQESITEERAWWDTTFNGTEWVTKSAGKVPAWLNYMTDINETYGNFAIPDNEMFMTLNRRYEFDADEYKIADLTTYIDPAKYNFIFAQTALDAQNFWVQIGMKITARRKQSSKVMPNI